MSGNPEHQGNLGRRSDHRGAKAFRSRRRPPSEAQYSYSVGSVCCDTSIADPHPRVPRDRVEATFREEHHRGLLTFRHTPGGARILFDASPEGCRGQRARRPAQTSALGRGRKLVLLQQLLVVTAADVEFGLIARDARNVSTVQPEMMRAEQGIERIDRLGRTHSLPRIVNLHYEGTVETDVCRAHRERIGLFQTVVGRLQPILAQLPGPTREAPPRPNRRERRARPPATAAASTTRAGRTPRARGRSPPPSAPRPSTPDRKGRREAGRRPRR